MDSNTVARAVLGGLLADPTRIDAEVGEVQRWIADNAERVGTDVGVWTALRSVEVGLQLIAGGTPTHHDDIVVAEFRAMSVATQVAVALSEFVDLDDETIARAMHLPVAEVEHLLDSIGHDEPVAPPTPSATPAPPAFAPEPPAPVGPPPFPPAFAPTPAAPLPAAAPTILSPSSALAVPPPPPPPVAPIVERTRSQRRRRRSASPPGHGSARTRRWIVAGIVVVGLIAAGLATRAGRPDQASPTSSPADRPPASLVDSATVRRDQLSKGCSSPAGDVAVAPTMRNTTVAGEQRGYRLIAPAPIDPGTPRALVVDLDDLGQTIDQHVAESRLDDLARALTLVVATAVPSAGFPQWNVNGKRGDPDDLGLIDHIIQEQTTALCVDQTRIMLVGRGAGAHLAAAYACSRTSAVSTLILVAGVDRPNHCPTPGRLSILAILGAEDDIYPMSGGNAPTFETTFAAELRAGGRYEPAAPPAALDAWSRSLDCVGSASQPIGLVVAQINTSCAHDGEVWRIVIPGLGHEWFPATYDLIVQFLTTGPFAMG